MGAMLQLEALRVDHDPLLHCVQKLEAAVGLKEPAEQIAQPVAPAAEEKLPLGQGEAAAAPVVET